MIFRLAVACFAASRALSLPAGSWGGDMPAIMDPIAGPVGAATAGAGTALALTASLEAVNLSSAQPITPIAIGAIVKTQRFIGPSLRTGFGSEASISLTCQGRIPWKKIRDRPGGSF